MRLWDTANGYGWVSIALHWLSAAAIVALLYTGMVTQMAVGGERHLETTGTHMTIAVLALPLLWVRVIWRLSIGHPGVAGTQSQWLHLLAKVTHYLTVIALIGMLLSGPLMVWAGGEPLRVFGAAILGPWSESWPVGRVFMRGLHGFFGAALLWLVLLHVLAVTLHVAVFRDGSFDRIMVPEAGRSDPRTPRANREPPAPFRRG